MRLKYRMSQTSPIVGDSTSTPLLAGRTTLPGPKISAIPVF